MIQLREHQNTVVDILSKNSKGQVIVPTGGGKTMCMIEDAKKVSGTVVVVAPRILLAEQLSSEFLEQNLDGNYNQSISVMHVHSGETHHFSSTKASDVCMWHKYTRGDKIIFTTYHSLHRIQESHIHVDTIYFDEAHNSVQKNFIEAVEWFSMYADRCYFFTATPKHSNTPMKIGMNDADIFGEVLINVPAPKLVDQGYILPPKVIVKEINVTDDSRFSYEKDCDHILDTIDDINVNKILICARSTKQIVNLISQSDFAYELTQREYNWLYITAKTGAVINGKKVDRETFFNTLNAWGKGNERFVVLHHSILSEGINVSGLEAALFLRAMDFIGISQTIGRVIRKGNENKTYGLIVVPCYDKVGITTSRRVNAVVDTVFNQGQPAISVVNK